MGKLSGMVITRSWIRGHHKMYQPRRGIFQMKGTLKKINPIWMITLNKNPPTKSNPRRANKGMGKKVLGSSQWKVI